MRSCFLNKMSHELRRLLKLFIQYFFIFNVINVACVSKKCCPLDSGLSYNEIEDKYECITTNDNLSEPLHFKGNISNLGIELPQNCTIVSETLRSIDLWDSCYDKVIEYVKGNATTQDLTNEVIKLKCEENVTSPTTLKPSSELKVGVITKCCPKDQSFDSETKSCIGLKGNFKVLKNIYVEDDIFIDFKYNWKSLKEGVKCSFYQTSKYKIAVHNKRLLLADKKRGKKSEFAHGNYCIDTDEHGIFAIGCSSMESMVAGLFVRKCCPLGEHYEIMICGRTKAKCVSGFKQFQPRFYSYEQHRFEETEQPEAYGLIMDFKCVGRTMINANLNETVHLTTSGQVYRNKDLNKFEGFYCMETVDREKCNHSNTLETYVCFTKNEDKSRTKRIVTLPISLVCLTLTLVLYCFVPSLRNVYGLSRMCHVIALLIGYALLVRTLFSNVYDSAACIAIGYGIYFSFISAFLWLNIMCFDMWWTFGSIKNQRMQGPSSAKKRFLWYSCYSWGIAASFTIAVALFDVYPVTPYLDAEIGKYSCFFRNKQNTENDWPHNIFFVIPIGVLIFTNLVLWILTAYHCAKVKADLHRSQLQDSNIGSRAKKRFFRDRANYLLTLRMLVVMGVSWVCEVISTIIERPKWLWFIMDTINELQGFFIFIILILTPNVLHKLQKRFGYGRPATDNSGLRSSSGAKSTTSWLISRPSQQEIRFSEKKKNLNGGVPDGHDKFI